MFALSSQMRESDGHSYKDNDLFFCLKSCQLQRGRQQHTQTHTHTHTQTQTFECEIHADLLCTNLSWMYGHVAMGGRADGRNVLQENKEAKHRLAIKSPRSKKQENTEPKRSYNK